MARQLIDRLPHALLTLRELDVVAPVQIQRHHRELRGGISRGCAPMVRESTMNSRENRSIPVIEASLRWGRACRPWMVRMTSSTAPAACDRVIHSIRPRNSVRWQWATRVTVGPCLAQEGPAPRSWARSVGLVPNQPVHVDWRSSHRTWRPLSHPTPSRIPEQRRIAMLRPLLLCISVAVSVVGCAATPGTGFGADTPRSADTRCLRSTGTHIPLREGRCSLLAGRVFSRADLARTGASTTADALQRLDLSVRVGP